jgi:hypothetical protein
VGRVVGAVAVVPAGPVEEDLDADLPAILVQGNDIGILDGGGVDPLLGGDMGDRLEPVAEHGRLLEVEALGAVGHLRLQLGLHLAGRAAEKAAHVLDDAGVVVLAIRPTQGAEQRLIWYCRQGRVRLSKIESRQLRSGKARSSAFRVSLTAPAEAKGPK